MSDGCGYLHHADKACRVERPLRQSPGSWRLKLTLTPLTLSPIGNGTAKFLLGSKILVYSRLLITCGTHHSTKPGFVALTCILSNHVLGILALLSASRARRLHARVFVKGSSIRSLSNKRTPVRRKEFVVDRIGLVVSEEVLRWKMSTNITPHTVNHNLPSTKR
jgi:hypothetical protein